MTDRPPSKLQKSEPVSPLTPTQRDEAVSAFIVGLSMIPVVGPLVAHLVGNRIPAQRLDRIADVLHRLGEKVGTLESQLLDRAWESEEFADLLEDGLAQATRALTPTRRGQIATLLKNGLSREDLDHLQKKRLLTLLGELNDAEIVILRYYGRNRYGEQDYEGFPDDVIWGPSTHMGSSDEEHDQAAVHQTYRSTLQRLGLLEPVIKLPRDGSLPDIDKHTGQFKVQHYQISQLGVLLLKYLDEEIGEA
jgi:hypothetical protein